MGFAGLDNASLPLTTNSNARDQAAPRKQGTCTRHQAVGITVGPDDTHRPKVASRRHGSPASAGDGGRSSRNSAWATLEQKRSYKAV
jgi:hypothetical protein